MDRRLHERRPANFEVRVTELEAPEISAQGQALDISETGLGISLPLRFKPGTLVRLNINDSVLYGFVAHATPDQSSFRTGIEVVQVLVGSSELSQLLKATLQENLPSVHPVSLT